MKFRLIFSSIFLIISMTACSMVEDVTPPPNYVSPTIAVTSTIEPPTQTPIPPTDTSVPSATEMATHSIETPVPTSGTEEVSTGTVEAGSPTPEAVGTNGVTLGSVSGKVVYGPGGSLPAQLTVTLRGFDMPKDNTSNPTEAVHQSTTILSDVSYVFNGIEIPSGRIFLAEVYYEGIPFQSGYVIADSKPIELPSLSIYEVTQDYKGLSVEQVHIAMDYSTSDVIQVVEMYIMTNPGTQAILVPTDGNSIPFLQIPEGASSVNYQQASGSATFLGTENGFAIVPLPTDQKYGLVVTFDLAYQKKVTLTQPFTLPVAALTVFAPDGVKISSDSLTDQGTQTYNNTNYHLYGASSLAANTTVTLTLTGKPKTTTPSQGTSATISSQKWLIIGLGAGGLLLIGVGLFFFIKSRKGNLDEEDDEVEDGEISPDSTIPEAGKDSVKKDIDSERIAILDALIALDDQFKGGEISQDVYEKRRDELKEKLKGLS